MAALVISDDAVTAAQGAHLVKSHTFAAGEAVDEDHGLARARIVERNSEIADLYCIHSLARLAVLIQINVPSAGSICSSTGSWM